VVDRLLGRGGREAGEPTGRPSAPPDPEAEVWARVQLARHLRRPRTLELVEEMADEWIELHGDRLFGDDEAIVTGFARFDGRRVVVIGHQKGADTEENIRRNFGMPHPEGYRKAVRAMELAERFRMPLLTFVDVPGAHPGPDSEERGIAEAIARAVGRMTRLRTPIVSVITGEGGSGGALAIAVADVVIGFENSVYSVISPEGCASILWRTADKAPAAALAMRMSASDQLALGVLDVVVPEPGEGAHSDHPEAARRLRPVIMERLAELTELPIDELLERRYARYRSMGPYAELAGVAPMQPERMRLADRLQGLVEAGRRTLGDRRPPEALRPADEPRATEPREPASPPASPPAAPPDDES
jgi:acetyl-CoA carboxylase carboxyl transferase subunit alpha